MKEEATHTQAGISIQQFFSHARYRKPMFLVLVVSLGSQLSGFNAVINYSTKIFQETFSEAKYLTLGVAAMNVIFTLVAFFLMEKAGRRKLLLTGFLSIAVCNLLMTVVDATLTVAPDIRYLQVIVVFCLISSYELGPGPISWFIAAELFDQPSRPVAMAFTSMLNWGGKFVLAFIYPPLQLLWHGSVYLVFMAMALVAFGVTWYRMPETKGRSFDDIAEEFRGAEGILLRNKSDFNTFN
ncbi:hypothetical protein CRUP_012853 [Coryphaenoides rupestris]|nr:hypothetical protein CRUP_012853 [Coryphaenoides rupestris]